jgi:PAS domain S-box-containing protein
MTSTTFGPDALPELCRQLTEESPLPTVAVEGPDHLVRYANPSFCHLAGKTSTELIGRPFTEAVPEGEKNGCLLLLDRVLSTGWAENLCEQEHAHSGALPAYWSYSVWALRDEAKRPVGVMLQVTDTTETVAYRQHVTAMNEELVLAGVRQHELRDLAESMNIRLQRSMKETHHRVKNNLQVVAALAEIQLDGEGSSLHSAALDRIVSHVRTLADLHDLLTQRALANLDDDNIPTQVMLERVIFLLQPALGDRHIHYEIAPMMLPMNRSTALSLLVSELVSNAVKHGSGDVEVTFQPLGHEARLTVSDRGAGFPPDFDPRTAANTGLELIMSMAQHDLRGTLDFANRPDGGGLVTVTFPLAP